MRGVRLLKLLAKWSHFPVLVILTGSCGRKDISEGEKVGAQDDDPLTSFQVTDESKLPECRLNREGSLVFIKSTNQFKTCESGSWKSLEIGVTSRTASESRCSIGRNGVMASINCGTDSITIQDGLAANGAACSVTKLGSVATITCGDKSVTISDGTNGATGTTGASGASCSVSKSSGIATVICGLQSVQIVDGAAGQSCSVSKVGAVATVTCGGQTVTVSDGAQGIQGAVGPAGSDAVWPKVTNANGNVIGTWVPSMDDLLYSIGIMTTDGKFFELRPDGKWGGTPAVAIAENQFTQSGVLYFSSTDCTGNVYMHSNYRIITNGILPTMSGWKISTGNESTTTVTRRSYLNRLGCTQIETPDSISAREYSTAYTPSFAWPIVGPLKIVRSN